MNNLQLTPTQLAALKRANTVMRRLSTNNHLDGPTFATSIDSASTEDLLIEFVNHISTQTLDYQMTFDRLAEMAREVEQLEKEHAEQKADLKRIEMQWIPIRRRPDRKLEVMHLSNVPPNLRTKVITAWASKDTEEACRHNVALLLAASEVSSQ